MSAERRRGLLMGFVGGAAVALALAAATIAIEGGFGESDPTSEAVDVIQQDYFKSVNESQLDDASIDGMVRALRERYHDRFSHYFDPKEFEQFEQASSGRFSGVGLTVTDIWAVTPGDYRPRPPDLDHPEFLVFLQSPTKQASSVS